jgi:hypothetical protein
MELVDYANTNPAGACKRSAEASTLRMPVGRWPARLNVAADFGNGQPMMAIRVERDADDDVTSVLYQQDLGTMQLEVFND